MTAPEKAILLPMTAAAFFTGLILGADLNTPPSAALGLFALASAFLVALSAAMRVSLLPALAVVVLILGLLRAGAIEPPGADLEPHYGPRSVEVRGMVTQDPTDSGKTLSFRLSVNRLRAYPDSPWIDASGDVWATARVTSELTSAREPPFLRYCDTLSLKGPLKAPEPLDDFDLPTYLEHQGIGTVMSYPEIALLDESGGAPFYRWLYSVRRHLAAAIAGVVPEPQAAFGQSILLGIRDNLPTSLREDFRRTGTAHVLAISGLHVGILLIASSSAGQALLGRRALIYLLAPLAAVWLYALLSGASPSAIRAAIMGTVYVGAVAFGRRGSIVPSLALAAALMAALDPRILHRISFQLSFAAMMGISVFYDAAYYRTLDGLAPSTSRLNFAAGASRALIAAVGVTLAATVATAPLIALYFSRLPIVGIPATLLTLPALPLALGAHGITAIVGLVSGLAATPFGWFAWGISAYITGVVGMFSKVPYASVDVGNATPTMVWAFYAATSALVVLVYVGAPFSRWKPAIVSIFQKAWPGNTRETPLPWQIPAIVIVAAGLVWAAVLSAPSGMLKVVFADVGQGDMTVITTPGGQRIVVDGGPDGVRAAGVLDKETPFWDRSVDLVVLTHPHADHVSGLTEIARRYKIDRILERRQQFDSSEYADWTKLTQSTDAEILRAEPGTSLSFDDGVSIQVLGPPDPMLAGTGSDVDNGSVVVRVAYGAVSFLVTGDLFHEGESWMIRSGQPLASDVLKVGHHGSRTSTSDEFLRAVAPSAAVISVAADNRFGHPDPSVVERLLGVMPDSQVFLTSERGSVTFLTDGSTISVSTAR